MNTRRRREIVDGLYPENFALAQADFLPGYPAPYAQVDTRVPARSSSVGPAFSANWRTGAPRPLRAASTAAMRGRSGLTRGDVAAPEVFLVQEAKNPQPQPSYPNGGARVGQAVVTCQCS